MFEYNPMRPDPMDPERVYRAFHMGPLVDVFILAALYTIRLFGGGEASGHRVSIWLLGFSSFLFLSLALVKRVSELYRLQSAALRKFETKAG